jgi:hypothetical protein
MPPTQTPTPTTAACWSHGGQVEVLSPPAAPTEFRIYLPPCYEVEILRYYPVLYLLHGKGFTDDQWDRLGVDETADDLIASGEAPPFIIVMPHEYRQVRAGKEAFTQVFLELIPWIDVHFAPYPTGLRAVGVAAAPLGDPPAGADLFGAIGAQPTRIFK